MQVENEHQRVEQVLAEIQAALALAVVLEIAEPMSSGLDVRSGMIQKKRWKAAVGSQLYRVGVDFEAGVQGAIFMGGRVVIAEGDQRAQLEHAHNGAGAIDRTQPILNHGCVFALHHKNGFLELE